jgi:protein-S-isoprenylcysteine O-methyltransferase Ste14
MRFVRALVAFLVLPGVVGGLLPWWIVTSDTQRGGGSLLLGVPIALLGLAVLLWCVRDFYVVGKGTLAPWDPPARLVVVGLYRYVRNPMYVGVLTLVLGWSIAAGSRNLALYCAVLAVGFHLRTILYEEPRLRELFGPDYERYCAVMPRWIPGVRWL